MITVNPLTFPLAPPSGQNVHKKIVILKHTEKKVMKCPNPIPDPQMMNPSDLNVFITSAASSGVNKSVHF